ncbi:MAG: alanine--tRNA ligase [Gammaproteobacteria bacterium]|nr:alanine--tRNA ligase [Gammaproteobacteria bacterium]
MTTSSAALRQAFLEYFQRQGHTVVASSPLVPGNDPTLLFTNAGMVQFKDVFLGREQRPYSRAATSQRCVRAGGKHNDLENVGYTARHHIFFEMLGNFSFGDYFKREAIGFAWEFLTGVLALPAERLWVTVYQDDEEAADIWLREIGVDPARFTRIGDKPGGKQYESDNFWSMGDTGPCGPCSEIFYDHGPEVAGGPPGSPDEDGDRYIEIWNLVFMQYDRAADGTLNPLPKPSVDTGMGLERLAAVMQGVHSNYGIDLFHHLIEAAAALAGLDSTANVSLRVIADHIRSCSFLVTDGVLPSNEGRGYVLRRIIRRAIRHGHKLGLREPFFHKLVAPLVAEMGAAYPELAAAQAQVERVLAREEERFAETLDQGLRIYEEKTAGLDRGGVIPGDVLFLLYDTYGFPVDLTADIARERGLGVDMAGFEREMEGQRERARAASQFKSVEMGGITAEGSTAFTGYERLVDQGQVLQMTSSEDLAPASALAAGDSGSVVLDQTPFYAESGGQVGDHGRLLGRGVEFVVEDTLKVGQVFVHKGRVVSGALHVGDAVRAEVNEAERGATACNHSATHLLHAALRWVLGGHVTQKGSLVEPGRLRFDFSHFEPMTAAELREVERLVNDQIRANLPVQADEMTYDEAIERGAMALFGEKYGDRVRVLSMGEFSTELCGGIHVRRTGDIGLFKIVAEAGVAAGVRRIEAVTGAGALEWVEGMQAQLEHIGALFKGGREQLDVRVAQALERSRALEKELERLKGRLASAAGSDLAGQAQEIGGVKVLAARLDGADPKSLRETLDQLKNKMGTAAIVLATVSEGKVTLVAGVTKDATGRLKAGELVNVVASRVGGRGGGRPDMAQAGGTQPENLDGALADVPGWVAEQLGA